MARLEVKSFNATATPSTEKTISFPGIIVSATLAATAISSYGINPQLDFDSHEITVAKSSVEENARQSMYNSSSGYEGGAPLEVNVSTISREELTAKLAQNKAEVDSVASSMKVEMAHFRTAYVESFAELSKTLNRIESRSDATEKRLTQAQWIVSLVISVCAVTLSAVIFFSNKNAVKTTASQPSVVINTSTTAPLEGRVESVKSPPANEPADSGSISEK